MKRRFLKRQQGAVLAFSLVMLLLLTLVSVSMIRQNKTQIAIASNAGQQVEAFATVETALLQTQAILEPLRYQGVKTDHHCKSGTLNPVHEGRNLSGLPTGITASVAAVYCLSNFDGVKGNENRCLYKKNDPPNFRRYNLNSDVGDLVAANLGANPPIQAVPSLENIEACQHLDEAGGWTALNPKLPGLCTVEIYTLNVTIDDVITNAQRTIESKFQIDCSGDFNP